MSVYTIKGVLFDMDGVVIDSNSEIERFWKEWTTKEDVLLREEDVVKYIHGRTTQDTIDELFQHSDSHTKTEILAAAIAFDLEMRPQLIKGAELFLRTLLIQFQKIALVTSAPAKRAIKMLELHDVYSCFACTITGDEVTKGKPNPEPYLRGAQKLNVSPEKCLVFEDSNSGILSALSAGMYVIAVNNNAYVDSNIVAHITNYDALIVEGNCIYIDNEQVQVHLF